MNKGVITFAIFYCLFLFTSSILSQKREYHPVQLNKISERLYEVIEGRGARGGAYIGDNGVLLIDAKMDSNSVNETISEIKKITNKPILYLVNTHSDGDHTKGNQYFSPSVIIIAHENCRKEFFHPKRDGSPSDWNKAELKPFTPSITFSDKMVIYLGSKQIECWYFGVGHTTGDAVIYFPEEKTAFIGDQIFLNRSQLIHRYKGGNSFEYVKTMEKMVKSLNVEKFCSGHSDMIDRNMVEDYINKMKERQVKIKSLMKKQKTLEEIKSEFDEEEARLVEIIYNELVNSK